MRAGTKTTLIVAIITGACVGLAVVIISQSKFKDRERQSPKNLRFDIQDSNFPPNAGWPMFRGGQGLLGRASGSLPEKLKLVWKFETKGKIKSSPAIFDGLVFIGSSDTNIYAIDLASGQKMWAYKTDGSVEAAPCVAEGTVFVGSSDTFLYAIDAKTGQLKWKYKTDGQILGAANRVHSPDGQSVWVLVGSYDNKLHCVDSADGKAVWTYETGNYVNGAPAIDNGKAIFGGCDTMIHVIFIADGNEIAQIDTGSFIAGSAALLQGRAYVGNYDGVFLCADVTTGKIIWQNPSLDSPIFSSPAVGENVVVFGGRDKRIYCLHREDGKRLWEFVTSGNVDSSPVICSDKVVVGCDDGRLYMIELSNGSLVWSYEVGQTITSSPAVVDGMVIVGSDDGFVYAFGGTNRH
jgi:outer membrane protein assembly factor BamB